MKPTQHQLYQLWLSTPPQGDPTGKQFALAFADKILQLYTQQIQDYLHQRAEQLQNLDPNPRSAWRDRADLYKQLADQLNTENSG